MSSTRRFLARPFAVSFVSLGMAAPWPLVVSRDGDIPWPVSAFRTAALRRRDRSRLARVTADVVRVSINAELPLGIATGGSSGWKYVVRSADIPLCSRCAARHRTLAPALSAGAKVFSCLTTVVMIPFTAATIAALMALKPVLTRIGEPPYWVHLVVFTVFASVAAWCAALAWWSTRFRRVLPSTDVARSCDFSDNLGSLLKGERHVYAVRNPAFAEAFGAANARRIVRFAGHGSGSGSGQGPSRGPAEDHDQLHADVEDLRTVGSKGF